MKKLWFHDRVSNKCFKTWMYFLKKCIIIYYVTNSNDEEQEKNEQVATSWKKTQRMLIGSFL